VVERLAGEQLPECVDVVTREGNWWDIRQAKLLAECLRRIRAQPDAQLELAGSDLVQRGRFGSQRRNSPAGERDHRRANTETGGYYSGRRLPPVAAGLKDASACHPRWWPQAVVAELHFTPERSVLSAPLTLAGAIAARTRRVKIGTAVQVLPLCHPLQLAEEAATVDHISQGRLIFGVGRSGFARVYAHYGVPYAE